MEPKGTGGQVGVAMSRPFERVGVQDMTEHSMVEMISNIAAWFERNGMIKPILRVQPEVFKTLIDTDGTLKWLSIYVGKELMLQRTAVVGVVVECRYK